MGYKYNDKYGGYDVYFSKRHPITRVPVSIRRRGVKTLAQAQRVERELIAEVSARLKGDTVPTWSTSVEAYLSHARETGISANTIDDYASGLRAHTISSWGDKTIDTITTQEIRDLIEERVGHRSPSHQKNILKFIRAVFTYAVESGKLNRNPVPKIKFRTGDKLKSVLTEQQVRLFLNKAKELDWEWYPHWALALYTGMRNGELYALRWDRVNFETRQIKVDTSWNNHDGFKSTKSGDDRIIEIAPSLLPLLKELKLQTGNSAFVLPRIDKWDKGEQARELRMFLVGMGLPPVRFHDLRATWATILLSKGVEPIKVMKAGGWKDMKTMMIYVRKAGVDIKGMSDCLELHNPATETGQVLRFEGRS